MKAVRSKVTAVVWELWLPIVLVVCWWLATKGNKHLFFPPPDQIFHAFSDNWFGTRFKTDFLPSLSRMGVGYGLATVIGILLGLVLPLSRSVASVVEPIIAFLRSLPSAALLPFALLAFGIGTDMQVFLITFVCLWPILLSTMDGVENVDPTMLDTARSFHVSRGRQLLSVVFMSAAPRIASGMRTSLSIAVVVMLISEMFASTNGIGYFTIQAQRTFAINNMWSGIVMLGLLGYLLNLVFQFVERRALRWYYDMRKLR